MISISQILLPVAFSEQCRGAARYAAAIASRFNSTITILHVAEPVFGCIGMECGAAMDDIVLARREQVARDLDSFFVTAGAGQPTVSTVLLEGDAAAEIVRYAHNHGVDLIVMPTHGFGTFRRFLMGSVTAKVLHDVTCPVWTGVHLERALVPEELAIQRVVCAVDLGPQTRAVLNWATGMASVSGASLSIVHAMAPIADVDFVEDELARLREEREISAEIHLIRGDVPASICATASSLAADLLVIGRGHGCGGTGRLPSHAYAILRSSLCPVVSV
jgi:nucleotide-binding universal stress UspA family protein